MRDSGECHMKRQWIIHFSIIFRKHHMIPGVEHIKQVKEFYSPENTVWKFSTHRILLRGEAGWIKVKENSM